MRILFLTTLDRVIENEHYFTKNVWKYLHNYNSDSILVTIKVDMNLDSPKIERDNVNIYYYKLLLPSLSNHQQIFDWIINLFRLISPDIIHSNMVEGYDVEAARFLHLKIVLTVHVGGFLCPRGGLNGFLMYNDRICDTIIGKTCLRCTSRELPLPMLSYKLQWFVPNFIKAKLLELLKNKQLFYLTPFLGYYKATKDIKKKVDLLNYATIIVANRLLCDIFYRNGLTNTYLLPHGVETRQHFPLPAIGDKIKFFYLGRIQYAKGIHVMLEAFRGLDKKKYELHVIGGHEKKGLRRDKKYLEQIKKYSNEVNVIFHGVLPNNEIDNLIRSYHVMIHPTICLEVYGITISESLSIGRPVLASQCGGAEMQVKDNFNGWLFPPNNIAALRAKLDFIIHHPQSIIETASNCENPFSIDSYVSELLRLYNKIML